MLNSSDSPKKKYSEENIRRGSGESDSKLAIFSPSNKSSLSERITGKFKNLRVNTALTQIVTKSN